MSSTRLQIDLGTILTSKQIASLLSRIYADDQFRFTEIEAATRTLPHHLQINRTERYLFQRIPKVRNPPIAHRSGSAIMRQINSSVAKG